MVRNTRYHATYICTILLLASTLPTLYFTELVNAADRDGDGTVDSNDACPWAAGLAGAPDSGCPDEDGDGFSDRSEEVGYDFSEEGVYATHAVNVTVAAIAFSDDGEYYYVGDGQRRIGAYNGLGNPVRSLSQVPSPIRAIDVSPSGDYLAVAQGSGKISSVPTSGGGTLQTSTPLSGADVMDIVYAPNETTQWMISSLGELVAWNGSSLQEFASIQLSGQGVSIDVSPDGNLIAATTESQIYLLNSSDLSTIRTISISSGSFVEARISPDGAHVLSADDAQKARVHEMRNGTLEMVRNLTIETVNGLSWSPGGSTFLAGGKASSGSPSAVVEVINFTSNTSVELLGASWNSGTISAVDWSPTGAHLSMGVINGTVYLAVESRGWTEVSGPESLRTILTTISANWTKHARPTEWATRSESEVTQRLCEGNQGVGLLLDRPDDSYATPASNFSQTGWINCHASSTSLVMVPIAIAPTILAVKNSSKTKTCIELMGGVTLGQMRYIISSETYSQLISANGHMPALELSQPANELSVAPYYDGDSTVEWDDLNNSLSCGSANDIILYTPSDAGIVEDVLEEQHLCGKCNTSRSWNGDFWQRKQSDIASKVTSKKHLAIGTPDQLFNKSNLYVVPIIDNLTHGSVDASAAGQIGVIPTNATISSGAYPASSFVNLVMTEEAAKTQLNFIIQSLKKSTQNSLDDLAGINSLGEGLRLSAHDHIPQNLQHLLPDIDRDGIWDGRDICAGTVLGKIVNADGCADYQLDSDSDGFNDEIDGCKEIAGNATIPPTEGCPDSDGDGTADYDGSFSQIDEFPDDPTQWSDQDNDGFGDNWATPSWNATRSHQGLGEWVANATQEDACPTTFGISHEDRFGCVDTDGDGWSDEDADWPPHPAGIADALPNESTQWWDCDGDGFGDNWDISSKNSSRAGLACAYPPSNPQPLGQWLFSVELADAFPTYAAITNDSDLDGFADDWSASKTAGNSIGLHLDNCPLIAGKSHRDRHGCPDSDLDGYSNPDGGWTWINGSDNFTDDPTQWYDCDGDGFGDNWDDPSLNLTRSGRWCTGHPLPMGDWVEDANNSDRCPLNWGNSTGGHLGCPDTDGDGLPDPLLPGNPAPGEDAFPDDPTRGGDLDQDGYDDAIDDDCAGVWGNSTNDRKGCLDSDGDGWSDGDVSYPSHPKGDADAFPLEATQWRDHDGDGWGDNYAKILWNLSGDRGAGIHISDAKNPDACPLVAADNGSVDGCPRIDSDGDGIFDDLDDCDNTPSGNLSQINSTGCANSEIDSDGDGWMDDIDLCPQTPLNELPANPDGCVDSQLNSNSTQGINGTGLNDSDGDGYGDNYTWTLNASTSLRNQSGDAFPTDPTQWSDIDGDGYGDNADGNYPDAYPLDATRWQDEGEPSLQEICLNIDLRIEYGFDEAICAAYEVNGGDNSTDSTSNTTGQPVASDSAGLSEGTIIAIGGSLIGILVLAIVIMLLISMRGGGSDDEWDLDEFDEDEDEFAPGSRQIVDRQVSPSQQQSTRPRSGQMAQGPAPNTMAPGPAYGGGASPYGGPGPVQNDPYGGAYSAPGGGYGPVTDWPDRNLYGEWGDDGWEYLEFPVGSDVWYYRDPNSGEWQPYG